MHKRGDLEACCSRDADEKNKRIKAIIV